MSGAALSPAGAVSVAEIWSRTTALPKGRVQPIRASNFGFLDELTQECVGAADVRRLVVLPIAPTDNPSEWIDELVAGLTGLLEASWPVWFGNHDFGWLRGDALGRERLRETVRDLVAGDERISPAWLKRAVRLLSNGRRLAAASVDPSIQIEQACIALSPPGIVLFLPFDFAYQTGQVMGAVQAVEWAARHADAVVVPVLPEHWPDIYPVDRLLFSAWQILDATDRSNTSPTRPSGHEAGCGSTSGRARQGISAVSGQPHPLSEVEKRVWAFLSQDRDLASLFLCNQTVVTRHGSRARVDLLWHAGGVVVELDGYADHSLRDAFERDRHRDYELLMSGYRVLRITNFEVERDLEAAVGKIRDVVRLMRRVTVGEEMQ